MPNDQAPPCGCKWFERAAKDPDVPVIFDETTNEFHLVHLNGGGRSLFYHCPFCGGRAPESLRGTLFADVSIEEIARLYAYTESILTEENIRSTHGEPDYVFPISGTSTSKGSDTEAPETIVGGRCLVYNNLSDTAEVRVKIDRYGNLKFTFAGKYIGPKEN